MVNNYLGSLFFLFFSKPYHWHHSTASSGLDATAETKDVIPSRFLTRSRYSPFFTNQTAGIGKECYVFERCRALTDFFPCNISCLVFA